ncbi:hypothetical protein KFE98_21425 [bacterium SCSIO 12741]|nr:hypothetical protein KFE98_21425 [bacterium SCSIO 12741]
MFRVFCILVLALTVPSAFAQSDEFSKSQVETPDKFPAHKHSIGVSLTPIVVILGGTVFQPRAFSYLP